ncbi:MAG: hypothetical protein U1E51_29445, partial [Candidatus Binatia bacterium]|nr:hypothetical protein [Candidatus Binatia bacterium]
ICVLRLPTANRKPGLHGSKELANREKTQDHEYRFIAVLLFASPIWLYLFSGGNCGAGGKAGPHHWKP